MIWFSGFSPILLQPTCSPGTWTVIPALIRRTSRMSAPASCSSILLTAVCPTFYYAWLRHIKATLSHAPTKCIDRLHPLHLNPSDIVSKVAARTSLRAVPPCEPPLARAVGVQSSPLYARMQAWLLHVVDETNKKRRLVENVLGRAIHRFKQTFQADLMLNNYIKNT